MDAYNISLRAFDEAYLEESRPVLEQYFQRPLSLEEVENIINSFLGLEEVVRKVQNAPQMRALHLSHRMISLAAIKFYKGIYRDIWII